MDYLWSPWRYAYIKSSERFEGCVFCKIAESDADDQNLVVHRSAANYVVLNRFPYTAGHAMVVPYAHIATLEEAPAATLHEMMDLTRRLESGLRRQYRPEGLNLGMNIGKSAGAGVAGHIHMHALPRWGGDSNFMSVIAETRVLPEALAETLAKLRVAFEDE